MKVSLWVSYLIVGPSTLSLLVTNLFRMRRAQLVLSSHWYHTYVLVNRRRTG